MTHRRRLPARRGRALLPFALAMLGVLGALALNRAPDAAAEGPELIYADPAHGDVLSGAPAVLHLCFQEPVNIRDRDAGGDFRFGLLAPGGVALGMRVSFQTDGWGVALYPGTHVGSPEGEWTLEWRVTTPETLEASSGTIVFRVQPGGRPPPISTPIDCDAAGPRLVQPGGGASGAPSEEESGGTAWWPIAAGAAAAAAALIAGAALWFARRRAGRSGAGT